MPKLSSLPLHWKFLLPLSLLAALSLRLVWLSDIEYKDDERRAFEASQTLGNGQTFPWLGMPSGVLIRNPGASLWVFAIPAKIFGLKSPPAIAGLVGVAFVLSIALLMGWILRQKASALERERWLWALSLVAVNPLWVWMSRKIWAQSILPLFSALFILAWMNRRSKKGSFFWGMIGAWIGQVHMSGFFFAFAIWAWTILFQRKSTQRFHWRPWLVGSVLGSLTLIPWVLHLLQWNGSSTHPDWGLLWQSRYWGFWFTDPLGLHLGNVLGVHLGNGFLEQNRAFFDYAGVAIAHFILFVALIGILIQATRQLLAKLQRSGWRGLLVTSEDSLTLRNAALIGYGLVLTCSLVLVRRYYLNVTFPLESLWLACVVLHSSWSPRLQRLILVSIWLAQLLVSVQFLRFVHDHQGAPDGDYGISYGQQHR